MATGTMLRDPARVVGPVRVEAGRAGKSGERSVGKNADRNAYRNERSGDRNVKRSADGSGDRSADGRAKKAPENPKRARSIARSFLISS